MKLSKQSLKVWHYQTADLCIFTYPPTPRLDQHICRLDICGPIFPLFAKLAEDGMSLANMLKSPFIINLIKNQNDRKFEEIAGCIIEGSDILTTLSATITEKNVQLLESKKGLFSLMEHAMRQPITSKTQRYVTASFCSKGKIGRASV